VYANKSGATTSTYNKTNNDGAFYIHIKNTTVVQCNNNYNMRNKIEYTIKTLFTQDVTSNATVIAAVFG